MDNYLDLEYSEGELAGDQRPNLDQENENGILLASLSFFQSLSSFFSQGMCGRLFLLSFDLG
jgi:hypothetical protein